jgi:hypothetical protein
MHNLTHLPSSLLLQAFFLAKLNGLDTWATNIGNAYMKAEKKEHLYIIAGAEFGELESHTLVFLKANYGFCSSRLHWHFAFCQLRL